MTRLEDAAPDRRGAGGGRPRPVWAVLFAPVLALCLLVAPARATDAPAIPALPSGLTIVLHELIYEQKLDGMNDYARFRFVTPDMDGTAAADYSARLADMLALCEGYALKELAAQAKTADIIVISLSDRPTEFGRVTPEAIQVFEAFRIKPSLSGGTCILEDF